MAQNADEVADEVADDEPHTWPEKLREAAWWFDTFDKLAARITVEDESGKVLLSALSGGDEIQSDLRALADEMDRQAKGDGDAVTSYLISEPYRQMTVAAKLIKEHVEGVRTYETEPKQMMVIVWIVQCPECGVVCQGQTRYVQHNHNGSKPSHVFFDLDADGNAVFR